MAWFIKDFSIMAAPLYDLLKANVKFDFTNSPAITDTSAIVKRAICNTPVLTIADEAKSFELVCDPYIYGIGALLLQEERPVAFYNHELNVVERKNPSGEQELLADIKSLQHWRYYVVCQAYSGD